MTEHNSTEQGQSEANKDINLAALPLIVAEYTNLRTEIMKLMELEQQLASGAVLALGVFLTIGMQADKPVSILLVYPLIAAFLAAGWMHKDIRIRQLAKYMRRLENRTIDGKPVGLGWGHFLAAEREQSGAKRLMGLLSASGIFIASQIFVVILACVKGKFAAVDRAVLCMDILCIITTCLVLSRSKGWNRVTDDEGSLTNQNRQEEGWTSTSTTR